MDEWGVGARQEGRSGCISLYLLVTPLTFRYFSIAIGVAPANPSL